LTLLPKTVSACLAIAKNHDEPSDTTFHASGTRFRLLCLFLPGMDLFLRNLQLTLEFPIP
jgi:hypothetical protein